MWFGYNNLGILKEKAEIVNDEEVIRNVISRYIKIQYINILCWTAIIILCLLFYFVIKDVLFLKVIWFFISFIISFYGVDELYKASNRLLKKYNLNTGTIKHFRGEVYELKEHKVQVGSRRGRKIYETYYTVRLQYKIVLDIDVILYSKLLVKRENSKNPIIVDIFFSEKMFNNREFQIQLVDDEFNTGSKINNEIGKGQRCELGDLVGVNDEEVNSDEIQNRTTNCNVDLMKEKATLVSSEELHTALNNRYKYGLKNYILFWVLAALSFVIVVLFDNLISRSILILFGICMIIMSIEPACICTQVERSKKYLKNTVQNKEKVMCFKSDNFELFKKEAKYYIKIQNDIVLQIGFWQYGELNEKNIKGVDIYFTEEMFNNYEFEIQPVNKD